MKTPPRCDYCPALDPEQRVRMDTGGVCACTASLAGGFFTRLRSCQSPSYPCLHLHTDRLHNHSAAIPRLSINQSAKRRSPVIKEEETPSRDTGWAVVRQERAMNSHDRSPPFPWSRHLARLLKGDSQDCREYTLSLVTRPTGEAPYVNEASLCIVNNK